MSATCQTCVTLDSKKDSNNAGLLYCMEYLEENMDWLQDRLEPLLEGETDVGDLSVTE